MRNKVSCNTTVNRSLLDEAKSLDIRLSEVFENALSIAVSEKRKELWMIQNKEAIAQHNQSVNESGTFSEKIGQLSD